MCPTTSQFINDKLDRIGPRSSINICYAGRAVEMKGAIDWINIINDLIKSGVAVNAIWLGDGSLLSTMKQMAETLGISDHISFPGNISDRQEILRTLKAADIFLFCHKTRESARVLGEALACGCPIVGYGSFYAYGLTSDHGGGLFSAMGDWKELAQIVRDLSKDTQTLRELVKQASTSGGLHDRDVAMQDRVNLLTTTIAT